MKNTTKIDNLFSFPILDMTLDHWAKLSHLQNSFMLLI